MTNVFEGSMMLSICRDEQNPGGRRWTRREIMRIGGLSALGLTTSDLARLRAQAQAPAQSSGAAPANRPRAHSCVFIFLFGGPSHIDLWDMKPEAPAEIRGEFKPIATRVPGIQLCEHLPLLAQRMGSFCLVRSMTHAMPVHGPACNEMYTGRPYFGPPTTDQAKPEDWPSVASLVARFGRGDTGTPASVVLPWYTQFAGQDRPIAGQVGGRMGAQYRPLLVPGDPSARDFRVEGLQLPAEVSLGRAETRETLLKHVESAAGASILRGAGDRIFRENYATAYAMLSNPRTVQAFDIDREPGPVRARYGDGKFAQSLLLARRLVEAGIALVTVNYDDESRGDKVSPFWDTHHFNFPSLKDRLAPRFDQAFSAFLEDLERTGLLESTLVVVTGEFGRTPKIGQTVQNAMTEKTGRDHWPHAFTAFLAGGGVRGGQVYGATNEFAAYVKDSPVTPSDLSATILEHLGIDPSRKYWDEFQQVSRKLSEGTPLRHLS